MSISVVIPYYELYPEKREILRKTVTSLPPADELIIIQNEGKGFAWAVNRGLELSKGDFICVCNDDIEWQRGTLNQLIDINSATYPLVNNEPYNFGMFFCLPRWVYERIGGLDEGFEMGYYEDDDYLLRLSREKIPIMCKTECNLVVKSGGNTMSRLEKQAEYAAKNKARLLEKWGLDAIEKARKILYG